jgi:hypothetical protein
MLTYKTGLWHRNQLLIHVMIAECNGYTVMTKSHAGDVILMIGI